MLNEYTEKTIYRRNIKFRDNLKNYIDLDIEITEKDNRKDKDIFLNDITKYNTLSISGNIREFTGGRPREWCSGQVKDDIKTTNKNKKRLLDIWSEYHLNDSQSGTYKQQECLKKWSNRPNRWSYDEDCEYLKKHKLYNDNNYRYGHSWLVKVLPIEIIKEIKELCNKIDINK